MLERARVAARVPGEEHHGHVTARMHPLAEELLEHGAGLEPLILRVGAREVLPRLLVGHLLEHAPALRMLGVCQHGPGVIG